MRLKAWKYLAAVALLAGVAAHAPEIDAQALIEFDLPAQSLGDTIRAIGDRGGLNVLLDPVTVGGRVAPAFKARATVEQALVRVLHGSGLKHQFVDDRTITIVPATWPMQTNQKVGQSVSQK